MPESINLKFIIIQGIGLIGAGIYFLSYQFKDNKKLFGTQLFAFVFYFLPFAGAFAAGAVAVDAFLASVSSAILPPIIAKANSA